MNDSDIRDKAYDYLIRNRCEGNKKPAKAGCITQKDAKGTVSEGQTMQRVQRGEARSAVPSVYDPKH